MKWIILIVFAGCPVYCDDSKCFIVEVPEYLQKHHTDFKVYWNVPTMQCRSKKIPFANLLEKYGILQNSQDNFRGEQIAILYDPGDFPALLKNESSGNITFRNGGVPQEGSLDLHVQAFKKVLLESIPDPNFSGVAVIDFESWRPIFRQNFAVLTPYKDISIAIEKKRHPFWPINTVKFIAKQRYEAAARNFMEHTIQVARRARPRAQWGYYAYPYCYNRVDDKCATGVPAENDRLKWLWSSSDVLFPSAYVPQALSAESAAKLTKGRVDEALRTGTREVLPYLWYMYRDGGYMKQEVLEAIVKSIFDSKASGFVMWGSSKDVNTVSKCERLLKYTEDILGPTIAKYTKMRRSFHTEHASDTSKPITAEPAEKEKVEDNDFKRYTLENPDYLWDPPENYTQSITNTVEKETKLKKSNNHNKNTLLDILYDFLMGPRPSVAKDKQKHIKTSDYKDKDTKKYTNTRRKGGNTPNTSSVRTPSTKNPLDNISNITDTTERPSELKENMISRETNTQLLTSTMSSAYYTNEKHALNNNNVFTDNNNYIIVNATTSDAFRTPNANQVVTHNPIIQLTEAEQISNENSYNIMPKSTTVADFTVGEVTKHISTDKAISVFSETKEKSTKTESRSEELISSTEYILKKNKLTNLENVTNVNSSLNKDNSTEVESVSEIIYTTTMNNLELDKKYNYVDDKRIYDLGKTSTETQFTSTIHSLNRDDATTTENIESETINASYDNDSNNYNVSLSDEASTESETSTIKYSDFIDPDETTPYFQSEKPLSEEFSMSSEFISTTTQKAFTNHETSTDFSSENISNERITSDYSIEELSIPESDRAVTTTDNYDTTTYAYDTTEYTQSNENAVQYLYTLSRRTSINAPKNNKKGRHLNIEPDKTLNDLSSDKSSISSSNELSEVLDEGNMKNETQSIEDTTKKSFAKVIFL